LVALANKVFSSENLHAHEDAQVREAVLASLEKRWANSDQDVSIAAVVLNPTYVCKPFSDHYAFTKIGLQMLLGRLWRRFNQKTTRDPLPDRFMLEAAQFFEGVGIYDRKEEMVDTTREQKVRCYISKKSRFTITGVFENDVLMRKSDSKFRKIKKTNKSSELSMLSKPCWIRLFYDRTESHGLLRSHGTSSSTGQSRLSSQCIGR
jgi:hypothetical protein